MGKEAEKLGMNEPPLKKIEKQIETIISLLGRVAFTPEKIHDMAGRNKQNPQGYIDAYNACDGNHQVTELATIAGVKQPTMTPILQEWEELGIIYEVDKPRGKFYKKLFPI
jgi:DNA-binding MarR family transcriptional regulator